MSFRHEDFPCCNCGSEGCVDDSRKVQCEECGKEYHPDMNTERFCYRCQSLINEEGESDESDSY